MKIKVKQTILKSDEALECMVTDSLKNDIREVCRCQRNLTNQKWVELLESYPAHALVTRLLKPYVTKELDSRQLAKNILTSFTRGK